MKNEHIVQLPNKDLSSAKKAEVRLKVCGMKYLDNIHDVAALQPDYLGFIFYEKSARFFDGMMPQVPSEIMKVGVFVNAPFEEIIEKTDSYGLDLVQLHGDESPEFCQRLKNYFHERNDANESKSINYKPKNSEISTFAGIVKVFSVADQFDFEELKSFESTCDYFLFDTKGKLPGGNGYTFDWEALKDYPSSTPYFLSGGIGLEEIEKLDEFLKQPESRLCHAIDVNSKFEIEPGLKNIKLLQEFKNKIKRDLIGFENM